MCSGRSTQSNKRNTVIINYLFSYTTLGHLADSVKPGGKLLNTIAEIGIYVLNRMVRNGEEIGHYFLIAQNLRNNRFEIMDSMRSMQDKSLETCCITIVSAIKRLWGMHYADSGKAIACMQPLLWVHMLMHIQHWDGRSVCNLDEKDICIIGKILTHTWLNFEENDTEWENILDL
ncbi:hypothetical protein C2845_PM15G06420 [Panicum miliaceum]|uniref:Uncharacterized protein n=1 Tax=Panicum miliaceum TaxID=4540 RepID=A0A3L6Q7M5_PANMI|nr:hypothetical protein C2845_PM15G06420 [Panicum miliaceum]